jgi:hypothetical protein
VWVRSTSYHKQPTTSLSIHEIQTFLLLPCVPPSMVRAPGREWKSCSFDSSPGISLSSLSSLSLSRALPPPPSLSLSLCVSRGDLVRSDAQRSEPCYRRADQRTDVFGAEFQATWKYSQPFDNGRLSLRARRHAHVKTPHAWSKRGDIGNFPWLGKRRDLLAMSPVPV